MTKTAEENDFPIVGVGASAGGLEALREMFGGCETAPGMAFVVVQHLDPTHESLMAELISRYTPMKVQQAVGGETLQPDHIYVIPPGNGLAITQGQLELTEFKHPRGLRRPIDDFFESLAKDRGSQAGCVILSGTGADGSQGLRAIKEYGGVCLVERPESAAYDGMPSSAINTGLVDIVCEPGDIIENLRNFFDRGLLQEGGGDDSDSNAHLKEICEVLKEATGHDFSLYKRSTLNRRIGRRMQVLGLESRAKYLDRLRDGRMESEALFRDLLINVTRFFRDPEHFDTLRQMVIDPLISECQNGEEVRVWVPGCSSGEEAYSIAMLMADSAKRHGTRPYIQIFATDIDEHMLNVARAATYPLSSLNDIPSEFRDDCVFRATDRFSITPKIRDMVRFSVHNVMRDPPYSKIDLISCRNLLIYFEDALQKQVIPLFHFALREGGRLFLGSSEAIGRYDDLFEVLAQGSRVFRRKSVKGNYSLRLSGNLVMPTRKRKKATDEAPQPVTQGAEAIATQIVAQRYAPVSFLLDQEGLLVERWGAIGRYLEFPDRVERNIHVPTLARPGLREVIGPLIRQVATSGRRAGVKSIEVQTDFGVLGCRVICEPVNSNGFLFVVEETKPLQPADVEFDDFDTEESQRQFLEDELRATRYRLRTTVEELETANEELKSSNEEMMSMNEELQSTNEELTTVNDELKSKVDQLTVANADLKNFFDSTQLPVLVVDSELRLRSFTDSAQDLFPIDKNHIGQSLDDLPSRLEDQSFLALAKKAAREGVQSDCNILSQRLNANFVVRAIPYRLLDGDVDGATLVFTDVTEAITLQRDLREESQRLQLALEIANIGIWEYEPATDKTVLDAKERELLNIKDGDPGTTMEPILASLPAEDRDRCNRALRMAIEGGADFDETFRVPLDNGQMRWCRGMGKQIEIFGERKFIGVTFDISMERELLDQRELMIREMNHRVKNLFSVISAMVSMVARNADNVGDLATDLRQRIGALGRSHALTLNPTGTGTHGVTLSEVIDTVLAPCLSGQEVQKEGSDLLVSEGQLTSLALILHEWATNSSKYGALSVRDGKIDVNWVDRDSQITLNWKESGYVNGNDTDSEIGFGTKLVQVAAQQLSGEATGAKTAEGFDRQLVFESVHLNGADFKLSRD